MDVFLGGCNGNGLQGDPRPNRLWLYLSRTDYDGAGLPITSQDSCYCARTFGTPDLICCKNAPLQGSTQLRPGQSEHPSMWWQNPNLSLWLCQRRFETYRRQLLFLSEHSCLEWMISLEVHLNRFQLRGHTTESKFVELADDAVFMPSSFKLQASPMDSSLSPHFQWC